MQYPGTNIIPVGRTSLGNTVAPTYTSVFYGERSPFIFSCLLLVLAYPYPSYASVGQAGIVRAADGLQQHYQQQGSYRIDDRLVLKSELRQLSNINTDKDEVSLQGAVNMDYSIAPNIAIYGAAQSKFGNDSVVDDSAVYSLGAKMRISDHMAVQAEAVNSVRSDKLALGLNYKPNKNYHISSKYQSSSRNGSARHNKMQVEGKLALGKRVYGFHKNNFDSDDKQENTGSELGLGYTASNKLGFKISAKTSGIRAADNANQHFEALSLTTDYRHHRVSLQHQLEYARGDKELFSVDQWLYTSGSSFKASDNLTLTGQLDYFVSFDRSTGYRDAQKYKVDLTIVGLPMGSNLFKVSGRYRYLYDQPSWLQDTIPGKRLQMLSFKGSYHILDAWRLSGNLDYGLSSIRQDRVLGFWNHSETASAKLAMDYQIPERWNAQAEYRWLDDSNAEHEQHNRKVTIYRNLRNDLRLGVGYSSARLKDDLTDFNFNNGGWFVSLAGKY